MAFVIYVKNEGDTGTVSVSQWINLNELKEIHNGIIEADSQVTVQALKTEENGDDRGDFEWRHSGSGLTGREDVRAEDVLRVE
ncbi:MAG TPA: hypothetical protein VL202_03225 [Pararhizobium sp.]|uniref:hypothetical protein n=1 Tax=Pararhizobium sp. TaxID=1977563 RepID=UPI002BE434C6|nr:hypothetical protein [Pararhizobium sp.]HTO30183.1 hypothetical protein [Pararhizobium sp.]